MAHAPSACSNTNFTYYDSFVKQQLGQVNVPRKLFGMSAVRFSTTDKGKTVIVLENYKYRFRKELAV